MSGRRFFNPEYSHSLSILAQAFSYSRLFAMKLYKDHYKWFHESKLLFKWVLPWIKSSFRKMLSNEPALIPSSTKMKIICRFSIKLELIFPNNSLFPYNFNITENCKSRSYVVNKRGIFNSMMLLGALSKGKLFFKSYLTSLESKTKMLFNQPTILAKPILRRYFPLNVRNFTFFK